MSLELNALRFTVDTKAFDDAIKKVDELTDKVQSIPNTIAQAGAKTEKSSKAVAQAVEKEAKAQDQLAQATKGSTSILQRQQDIREFMTQGFTRGQSSILAYAKAAKTADSDMQALMQTLKSQRALIGGDPFDKSLSSIEALKNEFRLLKAAQREYGTENGLTIKQLRELALEKERVLERMKIEKASLTDIKTAIRGTISEYRALAGASGSITNSLKERDRAVKDSVKANSYLDSALSQLNYRLQEVDKTLSTGSVNSLRRFEEALKRSGKSVQEQQALMKQYRDGISQLQGESGNRAADTISRAIGPQITDIVVGLATGQSLYMIALQQGGQLRDQFALAGVAAKDMGAAMRTAAREMVVSVAATAKAFGQLFVGMAVDGGKALGGLFGDGIIAVGRFQAELRGGAAGLEAFNARLESGKGGLFGFVNALANSRVAAVMFGTGLGAAVAVLVALLAAIPKVIQEENALSKALAFNGARLGLNKDSAYEMVRAYEAIGLQGRFVAEAMTEIAKTSGISRSQMDIVIKTAATLREKVGIPIEDTVKAMAEIGKDPVEALFKYSRELGNIPPALIEATIQAVRNGDAAKAAAIAQKAYGDAAIKASEQVRNEYGYLMRAMTTVTGFASKMWDAIMGWGRPDQTTAADQIRQIEKRIKDMADIDEKSTTRQAANKRHLIAQLESLRKAEEARIKQAKQSEEDIRLNSLRGALNPEAETARNRLLDERYKKMTREEYVEARLQKAFGARLTLMRAEKSLAGELAMIKESYSKDFDQMMKNSPGAKEAESLSKYFNRISNAAKDFKDSLTGATKEATKSSVELAQVLNDDNFKRLSASQQEYIKGLWAQNEALEAQEKAYQDIAKALEALTKAEQEYQKKSVEMKADIEAERSQLEFREEMLGKTLEQQAKITAEYEKQKQLIELAAKEQNDLEKLRNDDRFKGYELERKRIEEEIIKYYAEKRDIAEQQAAMKMKEYYQKEFDEITSGITDALVTALFEGGKSGSKKLRDIIMQELRKPITLYINAVVQNIAGDAIKALTGQGSGEGGISGLISTGKQLFDLFSKGAAAIGWSQMASLGKTIAQVGDFAGWTSVSEFGAGMQASGITQGAASAAPGSSGAFSTGMSAGKAGAGAIGVAAGMYLNRKISNGYSAEGELGKLGSIISPFSNKVVQDLSTVAAGALFGPLAAAITGAVAGLYNRAFGRKLTASGIEGTFGPGGFSGSNFQFFKGGTFRSDKTRRSALDAGTGQFLTDSFSLIKVAMVDLASSFGVAAKPILDFNKYVKVNLRGKNTDQIEEIFRGIFDEIREDMAKLILSGTDYSLKNEKAIDTLNRLKSSLDAVNSSLFLLGDTALKSSLASGDAAYQLTQLFGGVDKFQESLGSYYDTFFSEQEKMQRSVEIITATFLALGMAVPKNNEEFKKLVNSQDLTTEAGRAMFKTLIDISGTFNQVTSKAEEARKKFEDFGKSLIEYVNKLTMQEGASGNSLQMAKLLFSEQLKLAGMGDESAMSNLTGYSDRLLELAKQNASSAYEYEKILGSVKSELLGLAAGTGATTVLTSPLTPSLGTSPAQAGPTPQQQAQSTQVLLQSILDRLNEMSSSDRAEAVGVVSKLGDIAKVVTRADNGDSINVTVVA
jgi:phage-related minor tail protein